MFAWRIIPLPPYVPRYTRLSNPGGIMRKSNGFSMAGALLAVFSALTLVACSGKAPATAEAAAAAPPAGPRLYVLDCGTISPMDPALFSLKKEEIKGDAHFVSP